jgi:hypothetical protein
MRGVQLESDPIYLRFRAGLVSTTIRALQQKEFSHFHAVAAIAMLMVTYVALHSQTFHLHVSLTREQMHDFPTLDTHFKTLQHMAKTRPQETELGREVYLLTIVQVMTYAVSVPTPCTDVNPPAPYCFSSGDLAWVLARPPPAGGGEGGVQEAQRK